MNKPSIDELHICLIEESFGAVAPRGAALAARFFERLFHDFPQFEPMFAGSTEHERQKKLLASLVTVVANLRDPATLTPMLTEMGAQLGELGALPEHYRAVGSTLLKAIREYCGDLSGRAHDDRASNRQIRIVVR